MRHHEPLMTNELLPSDVKKGDVVAVVAPYNFHRAAKRYPHRDETVIQPDTYYIEYWTVAAIGKQLMRCVNEETGKTAKRNFYIDTRSAGAELVQGFNAFVTRPEHAKAMVNELFETDPLSTATMGETLDDYRRPY